MTTPIRASILFALVLFAAPLMAQDLPERAIFRNAMQTYVVAAAGDWATTYVALANGAHEANPLLAIGKDRPLPTVALGAASDAIALRYLWQPLARKHPRIATVGLYGSSALRLWVVSHNLQTIRAIR